ncbi:MAG: sensor histidine kinase, partial [Spirochaetota bacterium]
WREALSTRKAIGGNVEDFPDKEQGILGPQGIVSILVLPLFVNGEWKGFIGYDQTDRERSWSKSEALLLQTASDLLGGYLGRIESEKIIQRQLQEKELLIRETHHRIKNSFASIAGLLSLQADATTNAEARAVLAQATCRVTGMSDLYDKMLSSDDVRVVSAAPYLNDLIDSIVSLVSHRKAMTVEKQIDDFALDSDKLFPLGVIVNELLTNAMKYAFAGRETGTIRIRCEKTENQVRLVVKDDGVGLPEGFDVEASTGFGTSLVTLLGRQIGGTVTFEKENGTRVTVEFSV